MSPGDRAPGISEPAGSAPATSSSNTEETAQAMPLQFGHEVLSAESEAAEGIETATQQMMLLPGYELMGLLGRGGTSVVYKARHSNLRRLVALKMILGGANAEPEQLMRFRIEAETVAKLQHPNIVQIYEVGVYESCIYLALEYVEGVTVAEKYARKAAPPAEAARLVEAMARGVQHAHERGVVHRDLKPANVLLTMEGMPKIADFGLAKHVGSESMPNLHMSLQGTPAYMAPEQTVLEKDAESAITTAVDIYALGAILYELLTGQPPFLADTVQETLRKVVQDAPPSPRRLNPAIPLDLELICLKCLRKEPSQRYPTAEMLAQDLRRFLQDQPLGSRPMAALVRGWHWCRRHPRWASAGIAVLLIWCATLGATLGFAWRNHHDLLAERHARLESQSQLQQWQNSLRQLLDCNQLLQEQPNDTETLWKRAQLLLTLNERSLAIADCQKLLGMLKLGDTRRQDVRLLLKELQGTTRPPGNSIPD